MRLLLTGSSGLIGAALRTHLEQRGHQVTRLVRGTPAAAGEMRWDPAAGTLDPAGLDGHDAVIHLAGESISAGRWTAARKQRILDSRVQGTRLLATTLAALPRKPAAMLTASAIGFYGNRGAEVLDESSGPGRGFLAEVCRQWEQAARPAADAGLRVVALRLGVVLSPRGGALARMLTPFKLGLGGVLGSGEQYMSWIALDDVGRAVEHLLHTPAAAGPVNVVAPVAVTNREFTTILGRVLRRPTVLPLPAFAARLALGDMADELLLGSTRVVPRALLGTGFAFAHPDLEAALRHLLGR